MQTNIREELIQIVIKTVAEAKPLVDSVQRRDKDLADQIRRALSSIGLNTAEGFGTSSRNGNARLRFESARGSLYEAQTGLQIAIAWGYFTPEEATATFTSLDSLAARLYGLARR
jgi:four helix bundle protein